MRGHTESAIAAPDELKISSVDAESLSSLIDFASRAPI